VILAEYGLPAEFPIEVETLPKKMILIEESEIANRRDMRTLTFTIDPKMLKILMMLYHLKKLENGNYEIGIHIADVSYYLEEYS
jgi:ribonuclease R